MITGVATIANGGTHVKPRIVKAKENNKQSNRENNRNTSKEGRKSDIGRNS